jgi:hypothetical protein
VAQTMSELPRSERSGGKTFAINTACVQQVVADNRASSYANPGF